MMSEEQARLDGETGSLLGELLEAPVGRRSVLKAGLGSAVALGVGSMGAPVAEAAPKKKRRKRRGVETTDLHFVLGHVRGVSRLVLVVNGKRIPLRRHTKASREALRRRGGLWRAAHLSKLSHHVSGVRLPADRGLLVSVHGKRGRREVLVAHLWHVPRAATVAHARASHRATGSFKHVVGSSRRLAALGLKPAHFRSALHVAQLATVVDTNTTATGLTSVHPNIANKTLSAETNSTLLATPAVTALSNSIARLQKSGKDVAAFPAAKNADGGPAIIKVPIVQNGKVVGYDTKGFATFELNPQKDAGFAQALRAGLIGGIGAVRKDPALGAVIDKPLDQDPAASTQTWVQSQGVMAQAQPFTGSSKGAGIDINVKNPGSVFGTQTVVNGGYSNGQVPLKLYNNFVRWVWVYVQYLGKDNANLSANPDAKWPDTKYSQSLGLLPQVFTVLGIPLWDTNTIDVTLDFPQGAHTARILFCGLGSDIFGGGWRQYFPADAYPDRIAPSDEVLFASLVTGILTIGLTVFALVTDIDIATTWASIKPYFSEVSLEAFEAITGPIISRTVALTASETVAATVAAGGATYEDIANNGGSATNIWSILLALGSAIPKIIFNPGANELWLNIAGAIAGEEAASKLEEALPIIGEVIAVIEAVGDAVTLAEACAETIVSPWVIENEVTLSYLATVTINRSVDPPDSTFPATARSWRLEAKVDGAVVLDPITGAVNPNGNLQTGPLMVPVTAPFGGQTIQWSVVFLTAQGVQVGAGVSAQFTNNDPANPPTEVPITITEIPPMIDASTVFKRMVTTGYSAAAGGYTWSDQVTDSGTVASHGVQEVTGTAISTLAGVAGVVWEQGNRFYVRGVPIAQNGATISLGAATNEGYARRPFLLFDPFVGRSSQGNSVLLEPDPSTAAYNVRKVSLDPTTGAPTWDPNISYGTFLVPISAAALHSSGRVVAVHTDSGRLGSLLPVATPRAILASYTAGPGTQIGLLNSPIAVAVTNPGVVLVLEAASSQLAAFDLNGNPVAYFGVSVTRRALLGRKALGPSVGVSGQGQYTLPLVSAGTYLDLGVDGSGQMYLLYYTGDGSAPGDYHVDVYTPAGAVIDTHSPGVNVPHLAIDYFRSIFAANYDPLAEIATGKPHIDPALGVAEPSLSRFDPTELSTRRRISKPKPKPRRKHKHKHKPPRRHM